MTSVAFLVDQLFATAPGGIGTYTRELVSALGRADPSLNIALFHSRFDGPVTDPLLREHQVEELPWSIRRLYPEWAALRRPALPGIVAGRDVVHSPVPAAVPPHGSDQRLVVTVHDIGFLVHPELYGRRWRLMYRAGLARAIRSAHAIIAVSRHTAEDLVRRTRVDPRRVHVTPLAASLPRGEPDVDRVLSRLKVPRPYILYAGTLEPRKNLVRLVRAHRLVTSRGAPHALVLGGPMGWGPQGLLREISAERSGEVLLTGSLSPTDLDALYRGAAAFAYPSLYEGFGLPVLEAMARGIPCVVSTSSSLPEVAGEAAYLVNPRSVGGLAEALERVLNDTPLAAHLREVGPARAARFSWDKTARLTLEVYKSVL